MHSLAHAPKGTPSEVIADPLRPSVSIRFQILFHSPRRGSFHLSLTVLVPYRSPAVFSLGAWSPPLPAGFLVSCGTQGFSHAVGDPVRGSHPLRPAFPDRSPITPSAAAEPFNPTSRRRWFGLFGVRSPLLAESSLFLALLRCFSSRTYLSLTGVIPCERNRVSPFGHRRLSRLHTAWRRFSQCTTSFLGGWRPGIPRMPFPACCPCCGEIASPPVV